MFHEQLITWYNGLRDNTTSIISDLSLFPFLFPHGHGAYDGKISIHEYLKFCMNTLFSPFIMYKPYLLVTYDIWQSIQLIKETLNICLGINFKNIKQKFPHMIYAQNFQHIIKYKLPSSIQSSLRWHKSQFTRSINLECFNFWKL
jgi:hypothetical protein